MSAGSAGVVDAQPQPATTEEHSPIVAQSVRPAPQTSESETSRRRHRQQALDQHIDKSLKWHVWQSKKRTWTRAELDKEREDFFDTQVTGRPEVWQTVHAALRELWEADRVKRAQAPGREDTADDPVLGVAQGILRAAEITLPTGDLANGVYDSLGQYYALPEWIVRDPTNLVTDSHDDVETDRKIAAVSGGESSEEADEEETLRRREEKGKAVADTQPTTKIRVRISETSRDVVVRVGAEESVRSVGQKALQKSGLDPSTRRVRLIYLGKALNDDASLTSQGHHSDHVINAFINSQ